MTKCLVCNGTEFEVSAGARICIECGAHELNFLELEFDENGVGDAWSANPGKHFKIHQVEKSHSDGNLGTDAEIYIQKWSTFEAMNIILLDWIKALMHIGASEKFKDIAFKLWVIYLKKRRSAFRSALSEPPVNLHPQDLSGEVLSVRDAKVIKNTEVIQCWKVYKRKSKEAISKLERIMRKVERKKLKSNSAQSPAVLAYLTEQLSSTINTTIEEDVCDDETGGDKSIYERSYLDDSSLIEWNDETKSGVSSALLEKGKEDDTSINSSESPNLNDSENSNLNDSKNPYFIDSEYPNLNDSENPNLNGSENPNLNGSENPNLNGSGNVLKLNPSVTKIILGSNSHLFNTRMHLNPTFFTVEKLVSLLYIAILLSEENILLSDLLRWCKEGHIPYFTSVNLLRDGFEMTKNEYETYFKVSLSSAHSCRDSAGMLANFLSIQHLPLPSIQKVIDKFTKALNLPFEVSSKAMKIADFLIKAHYVRYSIPAIEVYCASLIIFALKTFVGLDGQQEYLLSEFADKFNDMMKRKGQLCHVFSWCNWQSYINRMQWWLNEVDVTKNHDINSLTTTDTHRLSQHFWTQGIWQNKVDDKESLNNFEIQVAENLLQIRNDSIKKMLQQDPLFKPYYIPYTGQIKQYITGAFERDPSPRKKFYLQIAQELNKADFSDHLTDLVKIKLEAKFKLILNKNVQIFLVSLCDKEEIFKLLQEEKKVKLVNNNTSFLILPDPIKMFWSLEKVLIDGSSTIIQDSNFMWLVKLFSELCETNEKDIIDNYRMIEHRYLNHVSLQNITKKCI